MSTPAPRLRDGLAVFSLDHNRVQIGLAAPVILDDLTASQAAYVASLERYASHLGATSPRDSTAGALLERLCALGVLAEVDAAPRPPRVVTVHGADALGTAIGACLAQSGIDRVIFNDDRPVARGDAQRARNVSVAATRAQDAARVVNDMTAGGAISARHAASDIEVVVAFGAPHVSLIHDLMARDQPHLPVVTDELGITVGPLVIPGQTACLTCIGIERTHRDPAWPYVALQCNGERAPRASAAVRSIAAGLAVDAVLGYLDRASASHARWRIEERVSTVAEPELGILIAKDRVFAHPGCGCHEPLVVGDDLENLQTILF